ncbi:MAG TPA: hypothetical protein VLA88_02730 [Candidatus Saccharimonadales bacterium]|nr:hypothetical protein [Candidatus Saccharimonadales bacterium]
MITLRRPQLDKKRIILSASIAIAVAVLGLLGWWLLGMKAGTDYKAARTTYNQNTTRALHDTGNGAFKNAADYDKRVKALQDLAAAAITWKNNRPVEPSILGIPLLGKEDRESQGTLVGRLDTLKAAADEARSVLEYEHAMVATLGSITDKTGKDAEEQKVLAEAWLAMLTKLKALSPPKAATTIHADLLGRVSNVQATLAALPELYTKKDYNGFSSKQGELSKHVDTVRALGDSYKALANSQDTALARAYVNLLKSLQ